MNENEINDLEQQLRSWVPRHPSAKVSRRLFAQPAAQAAAGEVAADSPPVPAFRLGWLAPVAASFLLMGLLFNQRNGPAISGSAASNPLVALLLSNQGPVTFLSTSFQRENAPPVDTFEWTNGSHSTSSIPSLSQARVTN